MRLLFVTAIFAVSLLQQGAPPILPNPDQGNSQNTRRDTKGSQRVPKPVPSAEDGNANPALDTADQNNGAVAPENKEQTMRIVSVPAITISGNKTEEIAIWFDGILAFVGVIGIIVAICTLITVRRQTEATRRAAEGTEASVEALIASERAWVLVDIGIIPDLGPDDLGIDIRPTVQNYGKTQARIIKFAVRSHPVKQPDDLPPEPNYTGENAADFILPPNKPLQPMSVMVPAQEFIAAKNMKSCLYIYGYLDYAIVGEKPKQTRFCLMYYPSVVSLPLPPGFYMGTQAPASYKKCT